MDGFEAVQAHFWVIFPPILLDILFWLGPHLTIPNSILNQFSVLYNANPLLEESFPQEQFLDLLGRYNLLTSLSPSLVGIPSLVKTQLIFDQTPIGTVFRQPLGNEGRTALLTLGMLLLGMLLAAVYLKLVANAVARNSELHVRKSVGAVLKASLRIFAFALLVSILLGMFSTVVFLLSAILGQFAGWIVIPIIFIGFSLMLWILLFNGFVVHGVTMQDLGVFKAIKNSVLLVRANASQMTMLFLLAYVLHIGLRMIWSYPDPDMWLFAIGIVGHAFIASAVLAATFSFYQDRIRWQAEMNAIATDA